MAYSEDRDGQGVETLPAADQHQGLEAPDMAPQKRTTAPAFQFYPKEFLSSSKVIAMGLAERGAYITLLSVQWLDGGLPVDRPALARILGISLKQFEKVWAENLERCFTVKHGKLVNERLERARQDQIAFRKAKAENGAKGGRPSKAEVSSRLSKTKANESSSSTSSSASASSSAERTYRLGGAPLHTSHKSHASCGLVCVPADLHSKFIRFRRHAGADAELRAWYLEVDREWTIGAMKDAETGADEFKFWRARFEERWPATPSKKMKPDTTEEKPDMYGHFPPCQNMQACTAKALAEAKRQA